MEVPVKGEFHLLPVILIIIILIVVFSMIAKMIIEHLTFVTTQYVLTSAKFEHLREDVKIVFLSDLHNRNYGENNSQILEAIRDEEPDLILVGGDMVVAKVQKGYDHALELMKRLPQICPVYACNGNHEQRMKENPEVYGDFEPYREQIVKAGVHLLENEVDYIHLKGMNIKLSGLELPLSYYLKKNRKNITRRTIKSYVGMSDERGYQILLTHYPQPFSMYKSWGADLVLAGHLHGGVIRIPRWRGLISPHGEFFPKYSGELTKEGKNAIVVSRGLGSHTPSIRLFNKAEIVVLTLTKQKTD